MDVYRINQEPYHTNPLSVIGSHKHGGRWNPKGLGILYTSRTPELALLETLVHLPPITLAELPRLWLSTLRLPNEADPIFWLNPSQMLAYWKSGTLAETQGMLAEWLAAPFCLAVAVPSAVMELSYNLLLHPKHPAFAQVTVLNQAPLQLDSRLR